ncbi:MAG: NAD regulator [Rhodobiaceae bacterium]|nr:MAG: NAD regulator [Rhodobiaceae bacterium]
MPPAPTDTSSRHAQPVVIDLNAAIVQVADDSPLILVVRPENGDADVWDALPFGPFDPLQHRTMDIGLRAWVREQTQIELGYVEQLYTFGDRGRHALEKMGDGDHIVSVGYLALTRGNDEHAGVSWRDWYQYFPWEDWRDGRPDIIDRVILPLLQEWVSREPASTNEELSRGRRRDRARLTFGIDGGHWDEENVLERFELLYEAGLVREAGRDGRPNAVAHERGSAPQLGLPMQFDHRRILATAMSRLRAKLKYRPVVFELMPDTFTLFELQRAGEALLGVHVHKQNFRRLVEKAGLVEKTGRMSTATGGRPAELFRFRREVFNERPAPGLKLAPSRSRANT